MKNIILVPYTKEHLISLRRIIAEYEIHLEKPFSKTHTSLIENITKSIESHFYTKYFMISKSELAYLFLLLQFRITQINKVKILYNTPGISDEIKWLLKPIETLVKKKANVLYMLLNQS